MEVLWHFGKEEIASFARLISNTLQQCLEGKAKGKHVLWGMELLNPAKDTNDPTCPIW